MITPTAFKLVASVTYNVVTSKTVIKFNNIITSEKRLRRENAEVRLSHKNG